jgi:hypothetical protein
VPFQERSPTHSPSSVDLVPVNQFGMEFGGESVEDEG